MYKDNEPITFNIRRKKYVRSRLMFPQDRKIDPRLSNMKRSQKTNDAMHCDLRLAEQLCDCLERYSQMTLKEINKAYSSQGIHYRAEAADAESSDSTKVFKRPSIGEGWKVKEFYLPSPTHPDSKVYEVLILKLDNNRASTLRVWRTHEKLMKLLLWQYPPKDVVDRLIGPLTFAAFAE